MPAKAVATLWDAPSHDIGERGMRLKRYTDRPRSLTGGSGMRASHAIHHLDPTGAARRARTPLHNRTAGYKCNIKPTTAPWEGDAGSNWPQPVGANNAASMSNLAWVPPDSRENHAPAGGEGDLNGRLARLHTKGLVLLTNEPLDAVAFDGSVTRNGQRGQRGRARPASAQHPFGRLPPQRKVRVASTGEIKVRELEAEVQLERRLAAEARAMLEARERRRRPATAGAAPATPANGASASFAGWADASGARWQDLAHVKDLELERAATRHPPVDVERALASSFAEGSPEKAARPMSAASSKVAGMLVGAGERIHTRAPRIFTDAHGSTREKPQGATTEQALLMEIYAERERLRRADRQRHVQAPKEELPSQLYEAQQHVLRSSESIGALLWRVNPGSRNNLFLSSIDPNKHM